MVGKWVSLGPPAPRHSDNWKLLEHTYTVVLFPIYSCKPNAYQASLYILMGGKMNKTVSIPRNSQFE